MKPTLFRATVVALCREHALGQPTFKPTTKEGTSVWTPTRLIRTPETMGDRPGEYQRWIAAHETAHIFGDHHNPPPFHHREDVYLIVAGFGMVTVLVGTVAGTVDWQAALATAGVGVTLALAGLLVVLRIQRGRERDADQTAAEWGYPMPACAVPLIRKAERGDSLLPSWLVLPYWLRDHDRPMKRWQDTGSHP